MSDYPYGNTGDAYPPPYGMNNSGYPGYPPNNNYQSPPPVPMYGDSQSYASPMPNNNNNNYSVPPYGINQMPSSSVGYPPPSSYGGPIPSSVFNQPPQQYGGFENAEYQRPCPEETPFASSGGLYPTLSTSAASPNCGAGAGITPAYQPPYQPPHQQQSSTPATSLEQYQGTVFPAPNFNAEADCQALCQAMRGFGTNERALIDIIANRSSAQRQQIKIQYKSMYGVDLTGQLGKELSGNFRETMTALFETPTNFDAWSLNRALYFGKEGAVREILLTKSNSEMQALVEAYRRAFNHELEKDINSRVGGTDFRRMLISATQANREELTPQQIQQANQMGIESVIDRNRARLDADELYKAGAGKWGTDEKTFNAIFARRNFYQLRATFEEYQKKYHQDMTQVIRSEFSGDIKDAYLVLIGYIRDQPSVFAACLHKAISGLGTNDSTLIRIIVTRSEIDLAQIKQRYQQMFNHSLAQDVCDDTSGDYKRILLALLK